MRTIDRTHRLRELVVRLKHRWLFPNTLDSIETVEKLVRFHVTEHNQRLPHSANAVLDRPG